MGQQTVVPKRKERCNKPYDCCIIMSEVIFWTVPNGWETQKEPEVPTGWKDKKVRVWAASNTLWQVNRTA